MSLSYDAITTGTRVFVEGARQVGAPVSYMHICAGVSNAKAIALPENVALGPHTGAWLFSVSSDPGVRPGKEAGQPWAMALVQRKDTKSEEEAQSLCLLHLGWLRRKNVALLRLLKGPKHLLLLMGESVSMNGEPNQ